MVTVANLNPREKYPMKKSFMALITPIRSDAHPDHELPKPQPPSGAHPDHTLPGQLPHPEHPIYYPLPPGAPVYPDQGLPGDQPHPDHTLPGAQPHPEHPIVLPPDSGGWLPVYIWGPGDPRPNPPIYIPPEVEVEGEKVKVTAIWTPDNGWETIVILKPQKPTVTPSKRK